MRIGYSCHDAFPSTDTNTQQIFWTLYEVARLGARVRLLLPAVTATADARTTIARHYGAPDDRLPDTLEVVATGRTPPSGALDRARFDWAVPRHVTGTPDVFWTRDPIAVTAAVRAGLPTVFETYRPDIATRPAFALWRRASLRNEAFKGLITHSRLAADAFVAAGVPQTRVLIAHNGFAPALMEPVLTREAARTMLALPQDATLVVYTGHVGAAKGTHALIALAARVPHTTFVIVGVDERSGEREALERAARSAGAGNIRLVARVPLPMVARYLYAADCLIIPPTDAPLRRFGRTVLPMKIFTYLASGRAIVAPNLPDIAEVLVDGQTARLVSATDPSAAADAVSALLSDRAARERLADNARLASREFTWAARAARIVPFFRDQLRLGVG